MYISIIVLPILGSIVSGFLGRKIGVSVAQLTKTINSVQWALNNPPKPHDFVSSPLQSKIFSSTSTFLDKKVESNIGVNSKEIMPNHKVLGDISRLLSEEKIIKDEHTKKVKKSIISEDEILEDTRKLRDGELLEKENIEKPFLEPQPDYIEEISTKDMPILDDFPTCDMPTVHDSPTCDMPTVHDSPTFDMPTVGDSPICDLGSQVLKKIENLIAILEDLEESASLLDHDEAMAIMLEICELWWFLFLLLILILGILAIIIHLLNKAKIKYLSKLSNKIKYINVTKSLASLYSEFKKIKIPFKSLDSIKLVEGLKDAIKTVNNAIDFYRVIKYIANKFHSTNKNSKKMVLTSNHLTMSDYFKFLDKVIYLEKKDLILKDIVKNNSKIIVYMYSAHTLNHYDMTIVEKHIRFNFHRDPEARLNPAEYKNYLAGSPLLLDLLFSYASIRDLAYAYQYILDYSKDSRLSNVKATLNNVDKLMWLTEEFQYIYFDDINNFNLVRLVECIRLYEELLSKWDDQLSNVKERYDLLEEIISMVENILKKICPPAVTLEFRFTGTVNSNNQEVEQFYLERYNKYAG